MKDLTDAVIVGFEEYRKTATIRAVRVRTAFSVKTLEGIMSGQAGDWLAEGIGGERWIIANDIFERTYELEVEPNEYTV